MHIAARHKERGLAASQENCFWALGRRLDRRVVSLAILAVLVLAVASSVAVFVWPETDPERVWRQARAEFDARRFNRADVLLKRLAKLRAPTPLDSMLRAQIEIAYGRIDEAIADLKRVPDGFRMAPQARLEEGQLELRRYRSRAAETAFLHAIKLDPKLIQARRELVYLYGLQLRRQELAEQFRVLSELTPLSFNHVFTWCLTRGVVWDPAEVSETLAQYLEADPGDRWSRLAVAESLRQLGRLTEADQLLAVLPASDADACAARARLALDRGDEKTAEALLAAGPPDHPGLERLRGRIAFAHQDGPAAIRHFRSAYAGEPDNRDTLFFLGHALRMVGEEDDAKPFLDASRDQDVLNTLIQRAASTTLREDPKLPLQLGAACEALHRIPEAKAWYKIAIARNPLDPEAQKALYRVDEATPVDPTPAP